MLLCGSLTCARAATYTWTGAGGSDWSTPASWNPGTGVPGPDDTAIVAVAGVAVTGNVSVGTLQLNGVTLAGTGTLTVLGRLEWTGTSSMQGGGTTMLGPDAVMVISGSGDRALNDRVLINEGRMEHGPGSRLLFYNSSRLENREGGEIDLQGDVTWIHAGGNLSSITNWGTVVKSAGEGTATIHQVPVDNRGTLHLGSGSLSVSDSTFHNSGGVRVDTGTLSLNGGGSSSGSFVAAADAMVRFVGGNPHLLEGASLRGEGLFQVNGAELSVDGPVGATHLQLHSGWVSGNSTLSITNSLRWTGTSTMQGGGTTVLGSDAVMAISGDGDRALNDRVLVNEGRVEHGPGSRMTFYNSSRLENREGGEIDLLGDVTWIHAGGNLSSITNRGTVVKSAGEGTAMVHQVPFENSGTLGCDQGILRFERPPSLLAGSVLQFRLSAPVHPAGHGRITCDQAMPIGGALVVEYADGFVPGPGEVYRIVSAPSVSGTFASYTAPPLAPGVFINPRYLANGVELFTTDPTPTVLGGAGLNAEGFYGLTIQGIVNQSYAVDASTDLEEWTVVATSSIPASTLWHFVDPESDLFPHRFYRVRFLP